LVGRFVGITLTVSLPLLRIDKMEERSPGETLEELAFFESPLGRIGKLIEVLDSIYIFVNVGE